MGEYNLDPDTGSGYSPWKMMEIIAEFHRVRDSLPEKKFEREADRGFVTRMFKEMDVLHAGTIVDWEKRSLNWEFHQMKLLDTPSLGQQQLRRHAYLSRKRLFDVEQRIIHRLVRIVELTERYDVEVVLSE